MAKKIGKQRSKYKGQFRRILGRMAKLRCDGPKGRKTKACVKLEKRFKKLIKTGDKLGMEF